MTSIIALFHLIPFEMTALSALAFSGIYASYRLAKLSDHFAKYSFKLILASAVLVPLIAYLANNYWVAAHNSAQQLALKAIPMNHAHLEAMYFVWWCAMSVLVWILYAWRKGRAA